MKRVLALLLCLTCLLGVLVSCGDTLQNPATPPLSDNQVQTPSENDQGNDSGQRPPTTEDQGGKTPTNELLLTEYTIVYPKKASKALKETAKRLQESINVRLNGQSVAVISDDQIPGTKYEILLGNTSRPISKDYYDDGVKSVFLVRNVNRTLFLGGFSDVLTMFLAMDAQVELVHAGIIPLADFVHMKRDRDILARIIVKKTPADFVYTSMRNSRTDFPVLACAAAKVVVEGNTTVLGYFIEVRPETRLLPSPPVSGTY